MRLVIRDAALEWCYIKTPDENGKYRTDIYLKEGSASEKALLQAISDELVSHGKTLEKASWTGKKQNQGKPGYVGYTAKTSAKYVNKKGEEVTNTIPLYDSRAQALIIPDDQYLKQARRANVEVEVFYSEYQKKFGVGINLRSIQLIDYEFGQFQDYNPFESVEDSDPNQPSLPGLDSSDVDDLFN